MAGAAVMEEAKAGGNDAVTQDLPEWVKPYAQNFLERSQQLSEAPYVPFAGQTVAQFNPFQTSGLNMMAQRAQAGSPVTDAAQSEATRSLTGGYLNANPFLDRMVDLASKDVMRNMDTLSARSGSFGNSGVMETTARTLGDLSTQIRGQDYARERGFMQNAMGMAPTLANQDYTDADRLVQAGAGFQGMEQLNLNDAYRRFMEQQNFPQQQLGILGRGLGMNYGTSQSQPGQSDLAPLIGLGMMGAGMYTGNPAMMAGGAQTARGGK